MKKNNFINFWLLLSVSMTTIVFNSCNKDDAPIDVTYISLDILTLTLLVGEEYTLTATIIPNNADDKTVIWTSNDESKSTVVNGKVTAISTGMATITAKAGNQTATCIVEVYDENVIINGVKWSTRNVSYPGAFVDTPESGGQFYQWNRRTADFLLRKDYENSNHINSDSWLPANDPSPVGYRVPTLEEMQSLLNTTYVSNTWAFRNGIKGIKFVDIATGNSIFLPANGNRYYADTNGKVYDYLRGEMGAYWSSTQINSMANGVHTTANRLCFVNDALRNVFGVFWEAKHTALSIRPVVK